MIGRNKKPNMYDMSVCEASSWMAAMYRMWNGESHRNMLIELNIIIDATIQAITEYQDTEFLPLIINNLSEAKIGITNLLTTYQKRTDVVAKLTTLLNNIDMQLGHNREILHGPAKQVDQGQN